MKAYKVELFNQITGQWIEHWASWPTQADAEGIGDRLVKAETYRFPKFRVKEMECKDI